MPPYNEHGDVIWPPSVAKEGRCQADGCAENACQRVGRFVAKDDADADSEGSGANVRIVPGSTVYLCIRHAADRCGVSTAAFDGFGDGMGGADESEELGWSS